MRATCQVSIYPLPKTDFNYNPATWPPRSAINFFSTPQLPSSITVPLARARDQYLRSISAGSVSWSGSRWSSSDGDSLG